MPALLDPGSMAKATFSGLLGAALGISITYSTGVASNRTEIVRLATKVEALTTSIQNNMNDRYRGSDAARDHNTLHEKIAAITSRQALLEKDFKEHLKADKR